MRGVRPADEDRLPWLEPYRESKSTGKPLPKRGYGRPIVIGAGAALLIAFGAGGYWLGQRMDQPSAARSSETIALPAPRPAPAPVAEAPPLPPPAEVAEAGPAEAPKLSKPKPARKKAVRRHVPRKKIRSAGVEKAHIEAVRAAQEKRPTPPPPPRPAWPKMPSPGPAGQVIQLGAFTTPTRANNAYRQRIARYPALARMPRVIVPVATKPGNRVLYVLRLGTASRQQSKMLCRNLRRSGDHCLVIG